MSRSGASYASIQSGSVIISCRLRLTRRCARHVGCRRRRERCFRGTPTALRPVTARRRRRPRPQGCGSSDQNPSRWIPWSNLSDSRLNPTSAKLLRSTNAPPRTRCIRATPPTRRPPTGARTSPAIPTSIRRSNAWWSSCSTPAPVRIDGPGHLGVRLTLSPVGEDTQP